MTWRAGGWTGQARGDKPRYGGGGEGVAVGSPQAGNSRSGASGWVRRLGDRSIDRQRTTSSARGNKRMTGTQKTHAMRITKGTKPRYRKNKRNRGNRRGWTQRREHGRALPLAPPWLTRCHSHSARVCPCPWPWPWARPSSWPARVLPAAWRPAWPWSGARTRPDPARWRPS